MKPLLISISKCIEDKLFYPNIEERYRSSLKRKQKNKTEEKQGEIIKINRKIKENI